MTVSEITKLFRSAKEEALPGLIAQFSTDERSGVQALIKRAAGKLEALEAERARLREMLVFEKKYAHMGPVCGIDEAGRGPLAGPVVAGAVILDPEKEILWLNDSKQLSKERREALYDEIMEKALAVGIGIVGPKRIDEINILQADYEAMCEAIGGLSLMPGVLLNDAVTIPQVTIHQVNLVHGDARSLSIAAASVIAKVTRDRLMDEYDELMPEYGFGRHKGYGTAEHIAALKKYGPSPIHRKTFITHFV